MSILKESILEKREGVILDFKKTMGLNVINYTWRERGNTKKEFWYQLGKSEYELNINLQ